MGSDQKAWAEELEEQAWHERRAWYERRARLEALGYTKIGETADEITRLLNHLEGDITSLSRAGWRRLDRIKELLKRLE